MGVGEAGLTCTILSCIITQNEIFDISQKLFHHMFVLEVLCD